MKIGAEECGKKMCYMYSKYFLQNEKKIANKKFKQSFLSCQKIQINMKKYSVAQILDSTRADSIVLLNE